MPKIKELPQNVVQKTAAGEVVERPASVVKELIENSIDAGALIIKVEIEGSGLRKIAVSDNGEGMEPEDVLLSFLPHTTSKIFSEDDLVFVRSLGF
ncbi:MAG: DNA mismatch repair protein, partial [uncultured bacterium]